MNVITDLIIVFSVLCYFVNSGTVMPQGSRQLNGWLPIDEETIRRQYEVMIFEDTTPGTVVFKPPAGVQNLSKSLSDAGDFNHQIQDGNKNQRFQINQTNGDIILAGYLDYNIDQTYELHVIFASFQAARIYHAEDDISYTLFVKIVDVIEWPLVYNESCETESREQSDWPALFRVYLGKEKFPADKLVYTRVDEPPLSYIEGDLNNDQCHLRAFSEVKDRHLPIQSAADILLLCSNHIIPNVRILRHYSKEDFPSDAIVSPYWFRQKASHGHYSLFQIDIYNIETRKQPFVSNCSLHLQNHLMFAKEVYAYILGCPSGKYGFKCEKECICQNGASCHVFNGACKCTTGWYGSACDIPRPSIVLSSKDEAASYGGTLQLICETDNIKSVNMPSISWFLNGQELVDEKNTLYAIIGEERYTSYSQLLIHNVSDEWAGVYTCQVQDINGKIYTDSSTIDVKCFYNTFGSACQSPCNCMPETSISCDRYRGCICKESWNGTHCQIDNIKPTIQMCPLNITQYVDRGKDFATVTWNKPESFDNSDHLNFTGTHRPNDKFRIGRTLVTYTAVDGSNNMATCTFYIHVVAKPIDVGKVGGAAISIFIILVPLFIYIGYKYRLKIYLAFSLPIEEYDDDDEKECDAFVTYSSKDEEFVDTVLTDLERDNRYRLCLHQRDFQGGRSIFYNIEEALNKSRCTILVLSPAFIESKWCQFETMSAMRRLVDSGQRLIPIMKEDVMHLELPLLMKRILDSVTYIKWTQNGTAKQKEKFWNELSSAIRRRTKHPEGRLRRIMIAFHQRILDCVAFRYRRLNNHEDVA
ncbi:uncharacterized protein [Ptychodera flava]|uniref:uncharacterized protein isoform X2 n=1 Tax=Ptychodera flava TaxID=63121 RepID=UPI003969F0C9